MALGQVGWVKPLDQDGVEDVFIACSSFETRSANVATRLDAALKIEQTVVFKFDSADKRRLREKNYQTMKKALSKRGISNHSTVVCDRNDPLDGVGQLRDALKQLGRRPRITLDVTAFTKHYLLAVCHFLHQEFPGARLRISYTRGTYGARRERGLTWGTAGISTVPFFNPVLPRGRPKVLVLILGFEADRAMSIYHEFSDGETMLIVPDPPSNPLDDARCAFYNRRLIGLKGVQILKAAALDPESVAWRITQIVASRPDDSIVISPLGSKMQTVGLAKALLGLTNPRDRLRTQVVYAPPVHYNESYYTVAFDKWPYETVYDLMPGGWREWFPAAKPAREAQVHKK